MTPSERKKLLAANPISQLMNDPHFVKKCRQRDELLIAKFQTLKMMPAEQLGEMMGDAFYGESVAKVGTFIKELSNALTDLALGRIAQATFEQCEMPKDFKRPAPESRSRKK